MRHIHHIIPKHMGGTDEPTNLYECSVEEHAELHLALYLEHGKAQDWVASQMLSGKSDDKEWARIEACRSQDALKKRSQTMTQIRKDNPDWVEYTPELRQMISERTLAGQAKAREKGVWVGRKGKPVEYEGRVYHTLRELSSELGISYSTCYNKIIRGEARYL